MPQGTNLSTHVLQIIWNCFNNGLTADNVYETCFANNSSIVTLPHLKVLKRMFTDPNKELESIEYINSVTIRGASKKDFTLFDALVSKIKDSHPLQPIPFIQIQLQPYTDQFEGIISRS